MTVEAMLTLAMAALVLSIKPGAGMMMIMSRVISQGMSACLTFMLGYNIVIACFLAFVFFGYHVVNIDYLFVSIVIKSLAAVYLIWMGVTGFQSLNEPLHLQKNDPKSFFDNFTSAMLITASNPLVIVFYAGILPTITDVTAITLSDALIVAGIVMGIETLVPILYSLPLAFFRYKLPDDFLKGLKIFSSAMLIIIGLYIGYTALPAKDVISIFG